MPKANITDYTPYRMDSAAAKIASQKSHESKRRKKKMREDFGLLLNLSIKKGELVDAEDVSSLAEMEGKNITAQSAIAIAMIQRAIMGDVQAAVFVRDTIGEKPSDKVEIDSSLTVEEWAKNHKVKL